MPNSDLQPLINKNEALQNYYATLESRIGYQMVLGGTRHFGYYAPNSFWPFPIGRALRAMEDHLIKTLGLKKGSEILDAGCGVGHVAIHLARNGYRIQGIDVVDKHISKAQRNVDAAGLGKQVTVCKMDYHHMEDFEDNEFDGAYTMETFVHATDPEMAAAEFYRIIRPGGRIAMFEYDHRDWDKSKTKGAKASWDTINKYSAMPTYSRFRVGVHQEILESVGFKDVVVEDLSQNVIPMVRLFFLLAYIPSLIVKLFGLEKYFVNTIAGVEGYRYRDIIRYVAVSARKPTLEEENGRGE